MFRRNYLRMQKTFQLKFGINANDFKEFISTLDSESRKILYARWGVEDGILCLNFKDLDKKLNMHNSKFVYQSIESYIEKLKFTRFLKDSELFPCNIAINLGILACTILESKECCIYGQKLLECIASLPNEMSSAILINYALISDAEKSSIPNTNQLTLKELKVLENFALRRLKNLSHKFTC